MSNSIFRKDGTAQGVAKQRLIESLAKPNKRVGCHVDSTRIWKED